MKTTNATTRRIDPELINLSGGLFERAHVFVAPAQPPYGERRFVTRTARLRSKHQLSWGAGMIAASLLVVGIAAARQIPRTPVPVAVPQGVTEGVVPDAPVGLAGYVARPAVVVEQPAVVELEVVEIEAPLVATPIAARPAERPISLNLPAHVDPGPNAVDALGQLPTFSKAAASVAIAGAARSAAACVPADDSRTSMGARVTFAPSGRVTSASLIGGPFLGTSEGGCIARALRNAQVRPFSGDVATVNVPIRIR